MQTEGKWGHIGSANTKKSGKPIISRKTAKTKFSKKFAV